MLVYVWFCAMMGAFGPGGAQLARACASAVEDQYKAMIDGAA